MPERLSFPCVIVFAALLAGCSGTPAHESRVFAEGEKATVDPLTYSVVDNEILTHLGDDANPRYPQTRFFVVYLAVSNSSNADVGIPGLTLVDDSGKTYPELADGSGVSRWLGVVRKVGPGQTERGAVLFDAPAGHYKLRLTEEGSTADVFADIPLSFAHERMDGAGAPADAPETPAPPAPAAKKK